MPIQHQDHCVTASEPLTEPRLCRVVNKFKGGITTRVSCSNPSEIDVSDQEPPRLKTCQQGLHAPEFSKDKGIQHGRTSSSSSDSNEDKLRRFEDPKFVKELRRIGAEKFKEHILPDLKLFIRDLFASFPHSHQNSRTLSTSNKLHDCESMQHNPAEKSTTGGGWKSLMHFQTWLERLESMSNQSMNMTLIW